MDVNFLLEVAIKETINLKVNEVFLLRELFKGYEWNRIERKYRLLLGTLFLNYVKSENHNIKILEKTSSGQQKYIITNKISN
ncbi:TPA: single-stranded DNA-binding protein [Streptococcus equi subsp. zooepidemicus]|nr:single-stranded DNA-binding protein [Streptococcus equi subsp. zooepidemicus]